MACLNHAYLVKHKLKDCTIMKNFMTMGTLSKGKKPERDLGGIGTASSHGEAAVMMIYG
jgi:hypothetical protein